MNTPDSATPDGLVAVYKPVGLTPSDCVRLYRQQSGVSDTISYAGRLDPMAEGVLLLLIGERANRRRREYEHLDKVYEVDVLFGFATDTGDLMGKIMQTKNTKSKVQNELESAHEEEVEGGIQREEVDRVLKTFVGVSQQHYPVYSSAKVQGKPLYWWARRDRVREIQIPSHEVRIDTIRLLGKSSISHRVLLRYIQDTVSLVRGDFRQDEIVRVWEESLTSYGGAPFPILRIQVVCGSGAYMRTLAEDIGARLNLASCALRIKRIRVGSFTAQTS